MEIKCVIKNLKTETKQLKAEAKESLNYLKEKKMPFQLEWIDAQLIRIDEDYNDLLDITKDGDKERLIGNVNNCYELLASAYSNLSLYYHWWGFLREIEGVNEVEHIDEKKVFFEQKSEMLKVIKY